MRDSTFYTIIAVLAILAAVIMAGVAFGRDVEICDYCDTYLPEPGSKDWANKVHLTTRSDRWTKGPEIQFRDYCSMDHMLADITGVIDETTDPGIPITILPVKESHWYDFIVDWFCGVAEAQELPTIAAADTIHDIYRIPEPVPLPSVAIYIDDNGHMVAKDEKGVMVDFDALGLNCDIMARDFEAMATMLRKIGDTGRKGAEDE